MLFIDQYYSSTLGRPLGISGIGDCLPASHLTFSELADSQKAGRLETYVNQYTVLSRQILSCDSLTNTRIDGFSDRLLQLLETLPSLVRFNASWLDDRCDSVPEWPLNFHATMFHSNTHNYLILLNRQRQIGTAEKKTKKVTVHRPEPGYATVVSSCHEVLRAFFYLRKHLPPTLAHWSICQQAFNAAMLLGLNVIEYGSSAGPEDVRVVASTYSIFLDLQESRVCRPAKLAAQRLGDILNRITHHQGIPDRKIMDSHGMLLVEDPEIRGMIGNAYTPFSFAGTPVESVAKKPAHSKGQPKQTSYVNPTEYAMMLRSPARSEQSQHTNSTPGVHSPDVKSEGSSITNSPVCSITPETPTYLPQEDRRSAMYNAAPMQTYAACSTLPAPALVDQQLLVSSAPVQDPHHVYALPTVYHSGYTDWAPAAMGSGITPYYAYMNI